MVEIWDLTPTPLDMLVGFPMKSRVSDGEYLLVKFIAVPACCGPPIAWKPRNVSRGYVVFFNAALFVCHTAGRCPPSGIAFALGRSGFKPAFDEGTFDVIVAVLIPRHRGDDKAESRGLRIPHDLAVVVLATLILPPAIDRQLP